MVVFWLLGVSLAAEPPCTGLADGMLNLSSDTFWVEWEPGSISIEDARYLLDVAEESRVVYTDLGWPFADEPQAITVLNRSGGGIAGVARTRACEDGRHVPWYELSIGSFSEWGARNVTAHELAHGAEYGFMGSYLDGLDSWLWFMEGTAVYLAYQVDGDAEEVAWEARGMLRNPHLGLHHTITAQLYNDRANHIYGTVYLTWLLDENYGGTDVIRDLWAYGGEHAGEPIFFPDAVEGVGLDWTTVWHNIMARTTVLDTSLAEHSTFGVRLQADVGALPAAGEPAEERRPEGLGLDFVRFDRMAADGRKALEVKVEVDPSVDWHVLLVRTTGERVGGTVLDVTPLTVGDNGVARGILSGFGGATDAYLVVSPESDFVGNVDLGELGYAWSWSASLVDDPGPMAARQVWAEAPKSSGCSSTSGGPGWLALLALAGLRRRR